VLASGQLLARQHVLALTHDTWLAALVDVAVGLFVEKPSPVWRVRKTRLTRVECLQRYAAATELHLRRS
jgi:hypothetical protein